jgi:hypothetical protein
MYHQVLDLESSSPRTFPGVLSTKVRDISRDFNCLVSDQETHGPGMGTLNHVQGP